MSEQLQKLNNAPADEAEASFLACCGSREWARAMTAARPFATIKDLLTAAERVWRNLGAEDWLEAFAAHPKIGERKAAPSQSARAAGWSRREQSGTRGVDPSVLAALAEANRLYEEKFGFIFIVCATGRTAEEMLQLCRERLGNSVAGELRNAAAEQGKITEIRLRKLLEPENQ